LEGVPIWAFLLRILFLYALVMVALRIMGKREIGQLSVFDFVVSVMVAELSTVPMEDLQVPLMRSIISIAALVFLQLVVAILQLKSHRFRHWVDGEPSVLIEHGRIKEKEMRRTRYTAHDLLTQLREKGFASIADVEFAILETSGQLSVFPTGEASPLTARDAKVHVDATQIPFPLVVDGVPVQKTLQTIGRDLKWLTNEVSRRGYGTIQDVFFAEVDQTGKIYMDAKDATKRQESMGGQGQLGSKRDPRNNTR